MTRTISGIVTSKAGDKTIVVTTRYSKVHPIYRKRYSRRAKFMAHDEKNQASVGDKVLISEIRPMSARKHFNLDKIVAKAGIEYKNEDSTADIAESEPEQEKK